MLLPVVLGLCHCPLLWHGHEPVATAKRRDGLVKWKPHDRIPGDWTEEGLEANNNTENNHHTAKEIKQVQGLTLQAFLLLLALIPESSVVENRKMQAASLGGSQRTLLGTQDHTQGTRTDGLGHQSKRWFNPKVLPSVGIPPPPNSSILPE